MWSDGGENHERRETDLWVTPFDAYPRHPRFAFLLET
jgi:hypothetical protein